MRFATALLLAAVPACASAPAGGSGADPAGGLPAVGTAEYAALSPAEQEAVEAERRMLRELARRGIHPERRPTQVTVKYHRSGVTIGLYNESYVDESEYYSQKRESSTYKVVDDIDMGALLVQMERVGFFSEARPGVQRVPGASVSVLVRRGDEDHTLAWSPRMDEDAWETVELCSKAVQAAYNATMSYQIIRNEEGADFFEQERRRLRESNAPQPGDGR